MKSPTPPTGSPEEADPGLGGLAPGEVPSDEDLERQSEASFVGPDLRPESTRRREQALGDFTTEPRILLLVPLALLVGALGAGVALGLLDMIGLITNALYFHRLSDHLVSPFGNTLGPVSVLIPVLGGLLVGLMARFGSEQIRGHGIPEAMERILINGSKVQPRLAVLKPISSAISIGTGGPFGAEGPIILTGGAVGSIVGQLFRLTAAQRRALLVAGAAAGMSAVFGTPVAATLFGVELLVFEWKPRSMVLIALSSAVADGIRIALSQAHLLAPQPLFPVPAHAVVNGVALLGAAAVGIGGGFVAWLMTQAVYKCEDAFMRLRPRLHWMWWPMIGGLVIGVGGLIDSRALGVGYDTIHDELIGKIGLGALIVLLVVKLVTWAGSLGSGTSGGILAPILIIGAALGGILGHGLPGASPSVWALVGMAAALAGVTRSPFTSIVFAFELTHDANILLALLLAASLAHLFSVLVLKRSILTEKVARRGFHVMREYAVDPLEATFAREVMQEDVLSFTPNTTLADVRSALVEGSPARRQRLYPVLDGLRLLGVVPLSAVRAVEGNESIEVAQIMQPPAAVAWSQETLRTVAERMASEDVAVMPVLEPGTTQSLVGMISLFDLIRGRAKMLEEERSAERVLRPWVPRQHERRWMHNGRPQP